MAEKRFWMVVGIGCGAPNTRHQTKEKARVEAERLAGVHIGKTFVVMKSIVGFKAEKPNVIEAEFNSESYDAPRSTAEAVRLNIPF